MRYWLLAAALAVTACSRDAANPAKIPIAVDSRSAITNQTPSAEPPYYWGYTKGPVSDDPDFLESQTLCTSVRTAVRPPEERPNATTVTTLADCSPTNLYYGLGMPKDAATARLCAYAELARDADGNGGDGLPATGILMNIYANGDGVPRDLDFATRMACSIESAAPFETDARVKRLQAMKAQIKPQPFDYCLEDVTSGFAAGQCAAVRSAKADDTRAARIASVVKGWSATDRALLTSLTKSEDVFVEAHGDNWYSFGGTIAAARSLGVMDEIRDFDADLLVKLAAGQVPAASPDAVAASDQALNQAYKASLTSDSVASGDGENFGQIPIKELRDAQRAWLRYRDAWLALVRAKWPSAESGVARMLNLERARQLKFSEEDG